MDPKSMSEDHPPASSEREETPGRASPPPPDPAEEMRKFLSRPTPSRVPPAKPKGLSQQDVARLMQGQADPRQPQPSSFHSFPTPGVDMADVMRQALIRKFLPLIAGLAAFMLGSGMGIGWFFRGWWNSRTSSTPPPPTPNLEGTAEISD